MQEQGKSQSSRNLGEYYEPDVTPLSDNDQTQNVASGDPGIAHVATVSFDKDGNIVEAKIQDTPDLSQPEDRMSRLENRVNQELENKPKINEQVQLSFNVPSTGYTGQGFPLATPMPPVHPSYQQPPHGSMYSYGAYPPYMPPAPPVAHQQPAPPTPMHAPHNGTHQHVSNLYSYSYTPQTNSSQIEIPYPSYTPGISDEARYREIYNWYAASRKSLDPSLNFESSMDGKAPLESPLYDAKTGSAIKRFFKKSFNFKGYASQSEFVKPAIAMSCLAIGGLFAATVLTPAIGGLALAAGFFAGLASIPAGISVLARRLRDAGIPLPVMLVGLIPSIGPFVLFSIAAFSQSDPNKRKIQDDDETLVRNAIYEIIKNEKHESQKAYHKQKQESAGQNQQKPNIPHKSPIDTENNTPILNEDSTDDLPKNMNDPDLL